MTKTKVEQVGRLHIEVTHRSPADGEPPWEQWWDWTVTVDEYDGLWNACAEGVSWRSEEEALRCARAIASVVAESEGHLEKALEFLDAKRLGGGYRWQWREGARHHLLLESTEAELVLLGKALDEIDLAIEGTPQTNVVALHQVDPKHLRTSKQVDVYMAWVPEHARESTEEAVGPTRLK